MSTSNSNSIEVNEERPVPKVEWNQRTRQAWMKSGFGSVITDDNRIFINEISMVGTGWSAGGGFVWKADTTKGPITRTIQRMIRLTAEEFDENGKVIEEEKEYLVYEEVLEAIDWLENDIRAFNTEGWYEEPTKKKKVTVDVNTGRQQITYELGKLIRRYYIPFSKKIVDDIISGKYRNDDTVTKTNKNKVVYIVKFPRTGLGTYGGFRCGDYSYDQFVGSFKQCYDLATQIGGPSGMGLYKDQNGILRYRDGKQVNQSPIQ
jgi:hypothetical protein